ncbi:alkylhydroperoxidase domain protein [Leucobacter viscericola]|uniref:Alkylhydroperoxidase domain protein n=1 Tax=Leucobacter viscericola TaxID=2714935 RepID=A0A6G7XGH5_9MICO|nr:alkylhydroperoxidase domain protein [Leucobacter viscericola]QIK63710.1 alkylhydroperoxidase domain protein [Leucobacter viscericola]
MTTTTETEIHLDTDVLAALTGIAPGDALDQARDRRPESREHTQGSFEALFLPSDASQVSLAERAAVALFVAKLHRQAAAVEFYGALLRSTGGERLEALIVGEARRAAGEGPYGAFRAENVAESVSGPEFSVDSVEAAYALGDRLAAALEHAHLLVLHPRDADRAALQQLLDAGWSTTGIVTLSQLVAFLTFQLRVVHGLSELRLADGGAAVEAGEFTELAARVAQLAEERLRDAAWGSSATHLAGQNSEPGGDTEPREQLPPAPKVTEPARFTQDVLGWKPWLEPLPVAEFTERHYEALVERERVHMPYFRVLARDPEALLERTLTDLDIFTNTDAGLPRAEREIAAAAASRFNGCVFCASVHSRFATEKGADRAEVQRLLDDGVTAEFGPRWNAIIAATVALTATPPRFGGEHVASLRAAGLDELELLDVIQAGAFFNWANRLMLSLGEPTVA